MKRVSGKLKYLLYVLPLFALLFTAQISSAASPNYEGEALYKRYCAACHDTGASGALPIFGVAGKGDSLAKLKTAITTGKDSANITTLMNYQPYNTLTDAQLQNIVNYTAPVPTVAVPAGANPFALTPSETTVRGATLASSVPMAVGNSTTFKWQYNLPSFSGKVDIVYLLSASNGVGGLDMELGQNGDMNKVIMEMPAALLKKIFPAGTTLTLMLAVVPTGDWSFKNYYFWMTTYTVQ